MNTVTRKSLVTVALLAGSVGVAVAADTKPRMDVGQREFKESCAFCHGPDGRGGMPVVELLKTAPPDLTALSKRNKGVFPLDRVYAMIDGREVVAAHGGRDMPVWGSRYKTQTMRAAEYYVDVPFDMEMYTRARILSLIDYLNRLQS